MKKIRLSERELTRLTNSVILKEQDLGVIGRLVKIFKVVDKKIEEENALSNEEVELLKAMLTVSTETLSSLGITSKIKKLYKTFVDDNGTTKGWSKWLGGDSDDIEESDLRRLTKRVISESQLLTEEIHCLPGTAGTGCGGGKIWCEVESGPGSGTISGCFCRHGNWCDQHGCNPECSGDSTMGPLYPEGDNPLDPKNLKGTEAVRDRGLEIGGGSGFVNQQGDSDRLTRFKGNNTQIGESDLRRLVKRVISEKKKEKKKEKVEKGKADCWVCANWGNHRDHFYCEKQQTDSSGNCDGYSSSDKCRRKCAKLNKVSINQVGIKVGNKITPGNELDGGKTPTTENIKRVIKSVINEQIPTQICPAGTMGLKLTPCPGTTYQGGIPMPYGPWYSTCATLNGQIPTQANIGDIITSLTNTSPPAIKYEILDLLHRNPTNPIQNYASSTCPTPTPFICPMT